MNREVQLLLNSQSYSTADLNINYAILPFSYTANIAQVDVLNTTRGSTAWLPVMSYAGSTSSTGTVSFEEGSVLDATKTYSAQVVLNRGSQQEIDSAKTPFNAIRFYIKDPPGEMKFTITNDSNGVPQMPTDKLVGVLEAGNMNVTSDVNWDLTTWYQVILPGTEVSPRNRNDSFEITWHSPPNQGVPISWGTNFGGGMVTLTANINVNGTNLSDTVNGLIEGARTTDNDRTQIINYLKQMKADNGTPSIRSQVGSNDLFFSIACVESCGINQFYPSIGGCPGSIKGSLYGIPHGSVYPIENSSGDGGFGIMQLTEWGEKTLPSYDEIWNWQRNIDASVKVVKEKLDIAQGYPQRLRSVNKKYIGLPNFTPYQLRMDVYSLYRGGHYWKPTPLGWYLNKANINGGVSEANRAVQNEGQSQCQQ